MIVRHRHDVWSDLLQNRHAGRRYPERKLLIRRLRSPIAERKFQICHKNISLRDRLPQTLSENAADTSRTVVGI